MKHNINEHLLNKYNKIFIPEENIHSEINVEKQELVSFIIELAKLGYKLDVHHVNLLAKTSVDFLESILTSVFGVDFKEYVIFRTNFAESIADMTDVELYLDAIVHYMTVGAYTPGGDTVPVIDFKKDKSTLVDLSLINKEELTSIVMSILNVNIMLPESDIKFASNALLSFYSDDELNEIFAEANIVMKNTLIRLTSDFLKAGKTVSPKFKTATDVLRFLAAISNSEFNNKYIDFKYFNRGEVRFILNVLETIYCPEDFKLYSKPWKKFFQLNAKKVNWNVFPKTRKAVDILFGKIEYTTKQGDIQNKYLALKQGLKNSDNSESTSDKERFNQIVELVNTLKDRPGTFARRIISILSEVKPIFSKYIINQFLSVLSEVDSRVLYQLKDRLNTLLQSAENSRFIIVKNKVQILSETILLDNDEIIYLLNRVDFELEKRIAPLETLGAVYIDPELKNTNITTSLAGVGEGKGFSTLGSKRKFDSNTEVLRLFTAWKNPEKDARTDIDLNLLAVSEDFKKKTEIAYYALRKENMYHSGDIINAPNGALEFIDVTNLEKVSNDYRYLIGSISSFSGQTFKDLGTVYSGLLELTKEESKKADMYSNAITVGYKNIANSQSCINFIIDLKEGTITHVDKSLFGMKSCRNLSDDIKNIKLLLDCLNEKEFITVYSVLKTHGEIRGYLVDTPEEADIVFDKESFELTNFIEKFL